MMRQKMNIVTLAVADLQRSLQFYRDGLGWKPSGASQGDIVFFSLGGIVLALYPRDKLAADATVSPVGSGFAGVTLAYNAKDAIEVDAVLSSIEQFGATLIKPAQKVEWGGYSGYFADPDGHLWEVAWNPFFPFDESDNLILPES